MGDRSFEDLRRDYAGAPLDEAAAGDDPMALFGAWFDQAVAAEIPLANAVALATVGADGQPSARMVLLKGWDARGFVFYTGYDSRKGRDLLQHEPRAALLFYWEALHRQVRIEGRCAPVAAGDSDAYFSTRPRASNLSAMASAQSQPVGSRAELERAVADLDAASAGRTLERPAEWGGFRLRPARLEFWQGREDRLHDRLQYDRDASGGWTRVRLCP
ncbi:MAG TPA: pyridoxamine 5'-phosphate oxidase [Kofleriaceae bacterium]|nr:pyridoxamine 5'-phosphate oxidase [Kofleriaceae bacterium]